MKTAGQRTQADRSIDDEPLWLELVRRQVISIDYGTVQIVVHGSRVVQIERTEKVRLTNPIAAAAGPV
jgi:hypothetical protein